MKSSYKTSEANRRASSNRYRKHKASILKKQRERYYKNRDTYLARGKAYRNSHKNQIADKRRDLKYRFSTARSLGKKYHLWCIDYEEYKSLIKSGCYYCESSLLSETGIGLDRVRNDKDYTTDNVVPCCKLCNGIKSNKFTIQEMQLLGESVKLIKEERYCENS